MVNGTTPVGSTAKYRCDEGFRVDLTNSLVCKEFFNNHADWDGTPKCIGMQAFDFDNGSSTQEFFFLLFLWNAQKLLELQLKIVTRS